MKLWSSDGLGRLTLTFPAPAEPLSINAAHRLHWAARRKRTNPWREMGVMVATRARLGYAHHYGREWPEQAVDIHVTLQFRTATRRDPHNYTGTVVKACVDGIVTGGLLPDDSPEWATIIEPTLEVQRDKTKPLTATVRITPRSLT